MIETARSSAVFAVVLLAAGGCGKSNDKQAARLSAAEAPTGTASAPTEPTTSEHAGTPAEHAGAAAEKFTAEQINAAMTEHIDTKIKQGGGAFEIKDENTGDELALELVGFHTPREISGEQYFLCTDFRPKGGEKGQIYDLDFWLTPKDGTLAVTQTRIHKHPVKAGAAWKQEARYKFVDDKVVEIP